MTGELRRPTNVMRTIIQVNPWVWVSSAKLPRRGHWGGEYWLIETWIFSDDPRQVHRQVIHKTEKEALIIHKRMVAGLRHKFLMLWNKTRKGVVR